MAASSVDGRQHRIDAAGQQRHPAAALALRRMDLAGALGRRRQLMRSASAAASPPGA